MRLNLLMALAALLRERSVTRAAERVRVSQPAMSAALAKLREFFQDPRLVRAGRHLELTPLGRTLLGKVEPILIGVQGLLGSRPVYDPLLDRRTWTLIGPDFITPWLMPPLMQKLQSQAPGPAALGKSDPGLLSKKSPLG